MRSHNVQIIGLAVVVLFSVSTALVAHPHNWIDVRVEIRFDENGKATGLYQNWLFDDYYSISITEELDGNGDGRPDASRLEDLRKTMFGNLKEYNYFTRVEQDGRDVPCGPVSQGEVAMQGNRLEVKFYIPFKSPRDPRSAQISYRIFDPSYYIEMLHAEAEDAIVLLNPPDGCRYHLEPPHPDPKKITYAASIPAGKSGGDLGRFFAERVTIECQNRP